ncbi:2-dehydro-3-deoxygluconokinase [compost metagenome]
MAEQLIHYMQKAGIDTSAVYRGGSRVGLYYLPKGKDLKNAGVIYDRAHSSFADLNTGVIDWDQVLDGISWFHFSAICPALNQQVAEVCMEAVRIASSRGITISVDLNYRPKLWQYGKQPSEVMPSLITYADVVMGNIWAAQQMLDIPLTYAVNQKLLKEDYLKQALQTSKEIMERFPRCKTMANTFRFDEAKGIKYYTTLYAEEGFTVSEEYVSDVILDKVGSGDCFMAGLIYGLIQQHKPEETLRFATAAAFNKLFIASDCTTATVAQIKETAAQYDKK